MTTSFSPISKRSRYEALDGMRGIAAFSVMIFHYSQHTYPHFFASAYLAVDMFFILSGFVIVHSYGERLRNGMSILEYAGKRLVRLYPMFLLGLVIGAPVLYLLQKNGAANSPPGFIAISFLVNLFYLPSINGFGVNELGGIKPNLGQIFPSNSAAWSLFFEIIASGIFLILYKLSRNDLIKIIACSYVVYLLCGFWDALSDHRYGFDLTLGWNKNNLYGGFPRVIFSFTYGILIYSLANDARFDACRTFIQRWGKRPLIVYTFLILVFLFPVELKGLYPAFILAVVAPAVVYVGSVVSCPNGFSLNIARFLGGISYPLYCLHIPIGRAVFCLADQAHYSRNLAIFVSIVISLIASIVLTKFYDEPARAYLSQKLSQWLAITRPFPSAVKLET